MEQEVATVIESIGFHVETNRAYEDLDESKSREIDVWAYRDFYRNEETKFSVGVELICECKNNSTPFVFLGRPKNKRDINLIEPSEYLFPIRKYRHILARSPDGKSITSFREVAAFQYLNLADYHYYYKQQTKAVQFCRMIRNKNSWEANHGTIYDGIFYPIVKALLSRKKDLKNLHNTPPKETEWKHIALFFPIVVLCGDIYYLDSVSKQPEPRKVPYITLTRELKSKTINGRFVIDFVKMDGLKDFIESQITPFVERVVAIVQNSPEMFLKAEFP